ncbi:MAG: hypothetical protein R6W97_06335 [Thiobacillus sp.]
MSRRLNHLFTLLLLAAPVAMLVPSGANAQSTAAKILEKSRTQAREIEELRKILNGPDQNMRLATFDAMVKSGDEAMRQIAYEAGLASADSVMRAMTFKTLMMSKDNLHLTLTPDPTAPKQLQDASAGLLSKEGNGFVVPMKRKNMDEGKFDTGSGEGQISGLEFVFTYAASKGSLTLQDDNSLSGTVQLNWGRTQFLAKAKLR